MVMLYGEKMNEILTKLNVDKSALNDRLHSTLLDAISTACDNRPSGGEFADTALAGSVQVADNEGLQFAFRNSHAWDVTITPGETGIHLILIDFSGMTESVDWEVILGIPSSAPSTLKFYKDYDYENGILVNELTEANGYKISGTIEPVAQGNGDLLIPDALEVFVFSDWGDGETSEDVTFTITVRAKVAGD